MRTEYDSKMKMQHFTLIDYSAVKGDICGINHVVQNELKEKSYFCDANLCLARIYFKFLHEMKNMKPHFEIPFRADIIYRLVLYNKLLQW